ncbi:MAG: TetR/AcrR family transcriptional regulator [Labilithrix sp.]|nr:TetR/AcrR family transcriptional regulator [Labilithrix sp.]MCW5811714.1 TetR/AcrR family transcriptional regulator [Labilithrix sp.]
MAGLENEVPESERPIEPPPGPKAKRSRDAAETKRRILWAAEYEFSQKGFDGARLSSIAKRARVPGPLIHHYFNDKEGLHAEVLRIGVEGMTSSAWVVVKQMDTSSHKGKRLRSREEIREICSAFVSIVLRFFASNGHFLAILRHEGGRAQSEGLKATKIVTDTILPIFNAVVERLDEMKKRGEIRKDVDSKHLVLSCVAMAAFPFQEELFVRAIWPVEWDHSEQVDDRHREIVDMVLARILP